MREKERKGKKKKNEEEEKENVRYCNGRWKLKCNKVIK